MILDLDRLADDTQLNADVAIIGAGAVGLLLGTELARRGRNVLILESGGRQFESAAQSLNDASVVGRSHLGIEIGRARVLGGTSTLWGGQLTTFGAIDFEARPELGRPAWPIRLDDVRPYYKRAAALLGMANYTDDDRRIWDALHSAPAQLGNEFEVLLTRWLRETNLGVRFGHDIDHNPNLRVLLHATAVAFDHHESNDRIAEVRVRSLSGRTADIAATAVVLACGTIEACRLMLATARATPTVAWANNSWVGKCFQDHLEFEAGRAIPIDARAFGNSFDNAFVDGFKFSPKIRLSDEVLRAEGLLNCVGFFQFNSSLSEHMANLKLFVRALRRGVLPANIGALPSHLAALGNVLGPLVVRYLRDHRMFNPSDLGISLLLQCEQFPLPESAVRLDESTDAHGIPKVRLDWKIDGRELETLAKFSEKLRAVLLKAGLARLEIDERLERRDPALLEACKDINHQCGGLQMSENAADGVVDSDLRVHGTGNLYVAGAAVFPSSSFANPTFTAMALSLRLADHLCGASYG